jgi:hypothetical protein
MLTLGGVLLSWAFLFLSFFFFGSTRVWIQGLVLTRQAFLVLDPLCQTFFLAGFFKIGSCKLFAQGWLPTSILFLISAYWVARITGVSHQCPTILSFFFFLSFCAGICACEAKLEVSAIGSRSAKMFSVFQQNCVVVNCSVVSHHRTGGG